MANRQTSLLTIIAIAAIVFTVNRYANSDDEASTGAKPPVTVFILVGQSNMQGHGIIAADPKRNEGLGSLAEVAQRPDFIKAYGRLRGEDGQWSVRDDVHIWYLDRSGPLSVGYGARQDRIGPELGFGHVVGDAIDGPVLLIKCAWGGKSLAVDFRPPSAGPLPYPLSPEAQARLDADPQIVGKYYRDTMAHVDNVLSNLDTLFPEYAGRSVRIAGFGWHQGWNDRINQQFNDEYVENFAHLIRDVRRDLTVPHLPVVIADSGMGQDAETHPRAVGLMQGQAAAVEREEFKGNVALVRTRRFWREKQDSPTGQGYHWNSNAETYYLIGRAMGEAMLKLQPTSN